MSFAAARELKRNRHACQSCRHRKARFSYRGSVRADRDHTLCFECYRSERERQRAKRRPEAPGSPPLLRPLLAAPAGLPGDRELAHRRIMLAHQERAAAARGGLRRGPLDPARR